MTPEEMNGTIEFLIQHSATFSAQMDDLKALQERDQQFLIDLTKQTDRFELWAAEVISRRRS
jgi:hypothetical protein